MEDHGQAKLDPDLLRLCSNVSMEAAADMTALFPFLAVENWICIGSLVAVLITFIFYNSTRSTRKCIRHMEPVTDSETHQLEQELEAQFRAFYPDGADDNEPWTESAAKLANLLKADYLELSALNSRRFFAAHRVLAKCRQGSLGIRLTCHYNLFAGTVASLGSPEQREWLNVVHRAGELGCFLLTETSAGVLSGLVVETTATWDQANKGFLLHTPKPESSKKWISQGLAARWGVCIAKLIVGDKDFGPHAFIVDMHAQGVTRTDMGPKTSFTALDNALVSFDQVKLDRQALLSKFCAVTADGDYTFEGEKPPSFLMVAQRLLSGRICISDAAVTYFGTVLEEAEKYTQQRKVWVDNKRQRTLRELPYMDQMFNRFHAGHDTFKMFICGLQDLYIEATARGELPRDLVALIAAAKIEAVEFAINAVHLLRRNVGSYGLMKDSPFGSTNEILLCCRFAEGDSRVLQQMLVRDLLHRYKSPRAAAGLMIKAVGRSALLKLGFTTPDRVMSSNKDWLLLRLLRKMAGVSRADRVDAWLEAGDLVYDLAKCHAHELIFESVSQMSRLHGQGGMERAEQFKLSILGMQSCDMCHQY